MKRNLALSLGQAYKLTKEEAICRFLAQVTHVGECWQFKTTTQGYGIVNYNGSGMNTHKLAYILFKGPVATGLQVAHNCPGGDHKWCCNPAHLMLLTPSEHGVDIRAKKQSIAGDEHWTHKHPEKRARGDRHGLKKHPECAAKGDKNGARLHKDRILRGEAWKKVHTFAQRGTANGTAKLTETDIPLIVELAADGVLSHDKIGRIFNVSGSTIDKIVNGKSWSHVAR